MTPRIDLSGKVAVVTGSTRGIGLALVTAFAAAGADVVVSSRKLDRCDAVAREIRDMTGRRALPVACHMGHWDEVGSLAAAVHAEFGRCDILVNNAGMTPAYPNLAAITEEYYDKVTEVNLKGPFRLAVLIGTRMAAGDGGSIINIGSIGALRPGASELVYCAAKAGLNAVGLGLAEAFGPKVRVNTLLPGLVDTDLAKGLTGNRRAAAAASTPLGRIGKPEDLVGPALWLASDESAFVTGTIIRVDGGSFRQM